MQPYKPYQDLNENLFAQVIYKCWPPDSFNYIEDYALIKAFYNDCYNELEKRLTLELNKHHPASWVLESYKQLEVWSAIYYNDFKDQVSGNELFAPIGRYGWRYIIEKSLERLNTSFGFDSLKPSAESMNNVFSLLFAMAQCSEYSNYLHHFEKYFLSASLTFSPYVFRKFPDLVPTEKAFFDSVIDSILAKIDWNKYDHIAPNNKRSVEMINKFLIKNFSISNQEINKIIESLIEYFSNVTGASITVHPLADFIEEISSYSKVSQAKVKSLMKLSLLDVKNSSYEERNFLRKSQQLRMLNHAGVILDLNSTLESIYDLSSSKKDWIKKSKQHIIISPILFGEWVDIFNSRLVLGQRNDLKQIKDLKNQIASIEQYFRIDIFEKAVASILENHGFVCLNLNKVNGKLIDCGEIDLIAYSAKLNLFYIIECKALAPANDARALGQLISDHYIQKKYHQKFLRKISWLKENIDAVKMIFMKTHNLEFNKDSSIIPFFITNNNSTIGLIEENYKIMTIDEFENYLDNGN